MKDADYSLALEAAKSEMAGLLEKRSALDFRITQLKATIDTLTALLTEKLPDIRSSWEAAALAAAEALQEGKILEGGISDAIRHVLMHSPAPMTPTQIRKALSDAGVDLSQYANSLSVIHNTLKRLESQGELMTVRDSAGKVVAYTTQFHAQ